MPKRSIIQIQIPERQPDRCLDCPLLGLVPKQQLPKGCLETYVCMATRNAMTARLVRSRVSEADSKHPRHRWCELYWPVWAKLPNRKFGVSYRCYIEERVPFEAKMQLPIIFHGKK